jgi:hypothetical protein
MAKPGFGDLTHEEIKDMHAELEINNTPRTPEPVKQAKAKSTLKTDCLRELLMLERERIASWFDRIVEFRPSHSEKPSEEAIQTLLTEIAELDALILTRSSAYQKRLRPDDALQKNDRERLKREETRDRNKKKKELNEARAILREYKVTPVTFGEKYNITHMRVISTDAKFVDDKLRTPAGQEPYYTEVLTHVDTLEGRNAEYSIEGYREFLRLSDEALAQSTDGMTIRGWIEWENKVILQAIECGLLEVNVEILKQYPGLDVYERPLDSIETDPAPENSLIIKTGAAQIMGHVSGAGWRGVSNNTKRTLGDFNIPTQRKGPEHQHVEADNNDDEGYTPD